MAWFLDLTCQEGGLHHCPYHLYATADKRGQQNLYFKCFGGYLLLRILVSLDSFALEDVLIAFRVAYNSGVLILLSLRYPGQNLGTGTITLLVFHFNCVSS